jgi:hypothetical protein
VHWHNIFRVRPLFHIQHLISLQASSIIVRLVHIHYFQVNTTHFVVTLEKAAYVYNTNTLQSCITCCHVRILADLHLVQSILTRKKIWPDHEIISLLRQSDIISSWIFNCAIIWTTTSQLESWAVHGCHGETRLNAFLNKFTNFKMRRVLKVAQWQ